MHHHVTYASNNLKHLGEVSPARLRRSKNKLMSTQA